MAQKHGRQQKKYQVKYKYSSTLVFVEYSTYGGKVKSQTKIYRTVGRPRNSWRRDLTAIIQRTGYGRSQAQDHSKWKSIVSGLCSITE
jgi:hypothetical protein